MSEHETMDDMSGASRRQLLGDDPGFYDRILAGGSPKPPHETPALREQTYKVIVVDEAGDVVYEQNEYGYSPMGVMVQLVEKRGSHGR